MRAWTVQNEFGLSNLRLEERPDPQPGAGELLLRIKAASLNYRDLMMIRGQYNPRQALPFVPCSDASCEVVAWGPSVDGFHVGQRVCPAVAQGWLAGPVTEQTPRRMLGAPGPGTLAELIVCRADSVIATPASLDHLQAATLPCAALTAYAALFEFDALQSGETVVVQGSGGVSVFALQLAVGAGARVIATTRSDAKAGQLRSLGAAEVITLDSEPRWGRVVRALTDGRGAAHVVEVGGAGTLAESLAAVRASGQISVIGVLSGAIGPVDLRPVLMRGLRLQGVLAGSVGAFERLAHEVERTRLRPVIDRVVDFVNAPAAFGHLERATQVGKIVVQMN